MKAIFLILLLPVFVSANSHANVLNITSLSLDKGYRCTHTGEVDLPTQESEAPDWKIPKLTPNMAAAIGLASGLCFYVFLKPETRKFVSKKFNEFFTKKSNNLPPPPPSMPVQLPVANTVDKFAKERLSDSGFVFWMAEMFSTPSEMTTHPSSMMSPTTTTTSSYLDFEETNEGSDSGKEKEKDQETSSESDSDKRKEEEVDSFLASLVEHEVDMNDEELDEEDLEGSFVMVQNRNLLDSFVELNPQLPVSDNTLVTLNAQGTFGLNPALSADLYERILELNNLSYALAKLQSTPDDTEKNKQKRSRVEKQRNEALNNLPGWEFIEVEGRTGRNNVDEDLTAIVAYNVESKLVVVVFHGSRSGSYFPIMHDGHGDWGANFDDELVTPSSAGLSFMPDDGGILIHRGFANNFRSAQENLFNALAEVMNKFESSDELRVFVTGHSKGGAMTTVATPIIKLFLKSIGHTPNIGAIIFSSPRAYNAQAKKWAHDVLGKANIIRINVHGDPATLVPFKSKGYCSVGILFLDSIELENKRTGQTGILNKNAWAGFHYGCQVGGDGGMGFRTICAPTYEELSLVLEQGLQHIQTRGLATLSDSFLSQSQKQ